MNDLPGESASREEWMEAARLWRTRAHDMRLRLGSAGIALDELKDPLDSFIASIRRVTNRTTWDNP